MHLYRFFGLSLAVALVTGCQSHPETPLNTTASRTAAYAEGIPGGTVTVVQQLQASITALDLSKRSFTLTDNQGNSRTLLAPPEMRNFEQLKVGDRVNAVVGLERMVYLREPGEPASDGAAGLLASTPSGDKPGLLVADTVEITATVKGMDTTRRTATLQLPDGSLRTVQVRPDIEMKSEYLGREVVVRTSSAIAVRVEPQ